MKMKQSILNFTKGGFLLRIIGGIILCGMGAALSGCFHPKITVPTIPPFNPSPPITPPAAPVIPLPPPSDGNNYRSSEFGRNYGLGNINADAAYQRGYFGQNVVVGVVDTGVRTTHRELNGNIVAGRDFVFPGRTITDPHGHGTAVAAVIAGQRDGTSMHGVAPRAKIMPLKIGDDSGRLAGNWRNAIRHAIANNVQVVNNSFGESGQALIGSYQGGTYYAEVPFLRGFYRDRDRRLAQEVAGIVGGRDIALVWAAGNGGWNGRTGRIRLRRSCTDLRTPNCVSDSTAFRLTRDQFTSEFVSENYRDYNGNIVLGEGRLSDTDGGDIPDLSSYYSSLPIWAISGIDSLLERLENGTISATELQNRISQDSNFRRLFGRWVAVVATDSNNNIASFSNGCGLAAAWCLAAPGVNIFTANSDSDVDYGNINGTSFSAPHVSGALALIKSRLPTTRMSIVVAIMLASATPLGADRIDETYGWGLLNVERAITLAGRLEFQSATAANVKVQNARINLPSAMAHLKPQLQNAQTAVGGIGNVYYNMPLADIAHVAPPPPNYFGDAAKDMLNPVQDNRFNAGMFFAATDTKTNQFQYAGAQFSAGPLGDWQLRNDF
ncbi:MAG: S8 family serine peptidase, partial [Betaproteobacteria bacterium]|nr:S8 family serine peptidase [Betaproteobacteria bacterium]